MPRRAILKPLPVTATVPDDPNLTNSLDKGFQSFLEFEVTHRKGTDTRFLSWKRRILRWTYPDKLRYTITEMVYRIYHHEGVLRPTADLLRRYYVLLVIKKDKAEARTNYSSSGLKGMLAVVGGILIAPSINVLIWKIIKFNNPAMAYLSRSVTGIGALYFGGFARVFCGHDHLWPQQKHRGTGASLSLYSRSGDRDLPGRKTETP